MEGKVHRRQFVISKNKYKNIDFRFIELKDGMILSYHKDLNVSFYRDKENIKILLGNAFQIRKENIRPNDELKEINKKNIIEKISEWSGRWIFIFNNSLYLDATGNLQCFYTKKNENICISSSLSIISEIIETQINNNYKKIEYTKGMDWYPAPLTILMDTKKLMYDEILKFTEKSIELEKIPKFKNNYSKLNKREKILKLKKYLNTLIKNIQKEFGENILLPLTAGQDSRTILAVCLANNIKFNAYTLEHPSISVADRIIPLKLSKKIGFSYEFIFELKNNFSKMRELEFEKHTFYQCVDADKRMYVLGQIEELKKFSTKGIILRGGIWEFGREFYLGLDEKIKNREEGLKLIQSRFSNVINSKFHEESIKEWLDNILKNPIENLNFRNRFYLEQRVGSWLASIEQALDLSDYERIHIVNCEKILEILNSFSLEEKLEKNIQKELIYLLEPKLLEFPFNNKTIFEKINFLANYIKEKGIILTLKKIFEKTISSGKKK